MSVFDIAQAFLARLASRVGKTDAAEIDREDGCVGRFLRDVEGLFAGAASGDENAAAGMRPVGIRARGAERPRSGLMVQRG